MGRWEPATFSGDSRSRVSGRAKLGRTLTMPVRRPIEQDFLAEPSGLEDSPDLVGPFWTEDHQES